MIYDHITNIHRYLGLHAGLDHVIELIMHQNLNYDEVGRFDTGFSKDYYLVQMYSSKSIIDCFYETHEKMIDLQWIIEGEELMGSQSVYELAEVNPYDSDQDIAFYKGNGSLIELKANHFCIFFTGEAHQPCVKLGNSTKVKKVVFKINK